MEDESRESNASKLLKYFEHGLLFNVLYLFLGIAWVFILALLVVAGFIIGLILGLILFVLVVGGLNAFITSHIWGVEIDTDWKNTLAHGFALFVLLLLVNIPIIFLRLIWPSLTVTAILFVPYCVIDGFIARKVAENWEFMEVEDYGDDYSEDAD